VGTDWIHDGLPDERVGKVEITLRYEPAFSGPESFNPRML
jgi:hypothetical protein